MVNERIVEYAFALEHIAAHRAHSVLDIGCGTAAWPALLGDCRLEVLATDDIGAYWGEDGFANDHWPVVHDDITHTGLTGTRDAVTCISTLEHIEDWRAAVAAMLSLGRIVIITVPFNEHEHIENVYDHPEAGYVNPYRCSVFNRADVAEWPIIAERHWRCFTGRLWTFGERLYPVESPEGHLAGFVLKGV